MLSTRKWLFSRWLYPEDNYISRVCLFIFLYIFHFFIFIFYWFSPLLFLWMSIDRKKRVWNGQSLRKQHYLSIKLSNYIEEQTTPWQKEKVQKDKQRSTKHAHKTEDRVTWTPLKSRGELNCSGRVSSSCSTSGTRGVNLVYCLSMLLLSSLKLKRNCKGCLMLHRNLL